MGEASEGDDEGTDGERGEKRGLESTSGAGGEDESGAGNEDMFPKKVVVFITGRARIPQVNSAGAAKSVHPNQNQNQS